jgi:hypothetical protein
MRAFWAALAISLALGVAGLISLVAAMSEYNSTLETYTELSIRYEPDSFVWTEPDFSAATTRMVIVNDSPADAVVENLIQAQGGTAQLSFTGSASVQFEGIERDLNLNVRERVGVVPAEGS